MKDCLYINSKIIRKGRGKIVTKKSLLISILIVTVAYLLIFNIVGFIKNNSRDKTEINETINKVALLYISEYKLPAPYYSKPKEKIPYEIKDNKYYKTIYTLSEIYAGPVLDQKIDDLRENINKQEKNNFRYYEGEITKVQILNVNINDGLATAEAEIKGWNKFIQENGKIDRVNISERIKFTLHKEDKWRITGQETNKISENKY